MAESSPAPSFSSVRVKARLGTQLHLGHAALRPKSSQNPLEPAPMFVKPRADPGIMVLGPEWTAAVELAKTHGQLRLG